MYRRFSKRLVENIERIRQTVFQAQQTNSGPATAVVDTVKCTTTALDTTTGQTEITTARRPTTTTNC